MASHGTASQLKVDGAYVEFQLAVLRALPRDIDQDVADGWRNNGQNLAKVLREALLPPEKSTTQPQLLIPVGTAIVAATTTPFVARDRFVVNTSDNAPLKISYLGGSFNEWFLGKVEQPFWGSTLKYGKLSRRSVDGPIIEELGGEDKAETTLTELFSLMQAQKNDKSGPLLTNGYADIFYVKDAHGLLRTIYADWGVDGWGVAAYSVTNPNTWRGGDQVFSRNS